MTLIDYRYDECGLDNVILKNLPVTTSDDGSPVVTIRHVTQLHRLLVRMVAEKSSGLEPRELRFLRTELEMTQAELGSLVGRDVQTIGRWERGETPIDKASEIVIRTHALQQSGDSSSTRVGDLATRTVKSARSMQFLVNASNPDRYEAVAA